MLQLFGFLSGFVPLLGAFPYIRDILAHKTKPHRGSFLIWSILGAIAFFAQLASGATWSLFLPASDSLATLLIFILALRYGSGGYAKWDIGGLVLAGVGLILWYYTSQPLVALAVTVAVDAVGTALTLHKTYHEPDSETFSSWTLASLAGVFAALAVGKWSFGLLLYPVYICIANGLVAVVIVRRGGLTSRR